MYESPVLLADGTVLCACDLGSEHARLAVLRPGGEPELLTADDADVEAIAVDRGRQRRACTSSTATATPSSSWTARRGRPARRASTGARTSRTTARC